MKNKIEEAITTLSKAIQEYADYARSWHFEITRAMRANGVTRKVADDSTAEFMESKFGAHIEKKVIIPVL